MRQAAVTRLNRRVERLTQVLLKAMTSLSASVLEGAVYSGELDPRGKSDDQLLTEMASLAARLARRKKPFEVRADYTDSLLAQARALSKGDYTRALGIALYATWVEHRLNHIVAVLAGGKRLRSSDVNQLLRQPVEAKTGWILQLLGTRRISPRTASVIRLIADKRNEFLHYKWQAKPDAFVDKDGPGLVLAAEKVVRSLRAYEARHFFGGRRSRIRQLVRAHGIQTWRGTRHRRQRAT